jgi:hypothetical protein
MYFKNNKMMCWTELLSHLLVLFPVVVFVVGDLEISTTKLTKPESASCATEKKS